jgi:hypothetical protein
MADALGARRTSRLSCVRRVRIGRCGPVEFELERETGVSSLVPSSALNSIIGSHRAQAAGTEPLTEEMCARRSSRGAARLGHLLRAT